MRGVRLAPTWLLVTGTAAAADLGVRVDGIAPLGGTLRVGLFDSAAGFAARGERAELTFGDLPPGRYAVTVHHDADDDGELDRLFALVAKEGVALGTNPPLQRAPAFADIAVAVEGDATVELEVVYPLGARVAAGR